MLESALSVFVYGTLKPGGYYWPKFCEGKVSSVTPAKIRGTLYDLHLGYPGARLEGEGWVHGFILSFDNQFDFDRVDELEGFVSQRPKSQNEYNRLKVECFSSGGAPLGQVWAYEVTEHVLQHCKGTQLVDGNWPV